MRVYSKDRTQWVERPDPVKVLSGDARERQVQIDALRNAGLIESKLAGKLMRGLRREKNGGS
jgi:hypothetical protein